MRISIEHGRVIDPAGRVDSRLNLVLKDGKVAALTTDIVEADRHIDASGRVVCPGFVDIHMHEAPVRDLGDLNKSIFGAMVRMGVTTMVGGNCGDNVLPPEEYFRAVEQSGLPGNLALLAGHGAAREAIGVHDRYVTLTDEQVRQVAEVLNRWLEAGCWGISYGIRYYPGMDRRELMATAKLCQKDHLLVAAHVRDDAAYIFDSIDEFLAPGWTYGLKMQVSHLGSMGGYGQMAQVLAKLDAARSRGLDVMADCYPYSAFSTEIGETTYDPGFLERYHCDYSDIVLCDGKYKGQRCTEEIFRELRETEPDTITVAHVMRPGDVELAMTHPAVMLCSDGLMHGGQGHPRAAGTFPRLTAEYVRGGKLSLYQAVEKMTSLPAQRLGLKHKGNLSTGSDADVVIFDPETIQDRATFQEPDLAPEGIDYVLVGGEVACDHGKLVRTDLGRVLKRG